MAVVIELNDEEQELLVDVLRREQAGLVIERESPRPKEVIGVLSRRCAIVRRLLSHVLEEDSDESDHQRIAGYC